jgi:hypothetical protein
MSFLYFKEIISIYFKVFLIHLTRVDRLTHVLGLIGT